MFWHFFLAIGLSLGLTPFVKRLAIRLHCVDAPAGVRKIHKLPVPLLGGWAVFFAFALSLAAVFLTDFVRLQTLPLKFLLGILLGSFVLMVGGFLDDRYTLPAKLMWLFPGLASLLVIWSGVGVGIKFITNPFGGVISLDYAIIGLPISAIFIFFWLMVATYTTKILDGLDGLASGVGAIGAFIMFLLSMRPEVNQPATALLALMLVGALVGFLPYVWHPAKIFLGESGSTFIGFMLGVLAVLSGAKIATAIVVMGLPLLDIAWAVVRRLARGQNPFRGDREHLHHLFLNAGLSQKQAVLCYYLASAGFGMTAVFLQSRGKFWAIILLVCLMAGLIVFLNYLAKNRTVDKGGFK